MGTLDVLLVEGTPGCAAREAGVIEDAGHRIHRCHEPGVPGFPCRILSGQERCPLDEGIDVALVVREAEARPSVFELGVGCAVSAGVPVVEGGPIFLPPR